MKTYEDLEGDGGSNIIGQVVELGEKLRSRLDKIKHKVALMSGKGGVGKSSITANIASCLADRGNKVGILDADLNGPSIGHLLGVGNDQKLEMKDDGLDPGIGHQEIRIMSMDMLVKTADTPVMWTEEADATAVWVSTMESTAIRELLADTNWGELDYLLIDMPPGSDRIDNIRSLIPELAGVVEITIPSPLSQHIVTKSITKNNKMGVPINDWTGKIIGSTFENANTAITPKHGGNVFCAIEVITAATFASSEGLIAEQYDHDSRGYSDANPDGIASDTKSGWINTEDTDAKIGAGKGTSGAFDYRDLIGHSSYQYSEFAYFDLSEPWGVTRRFYFYNSLNYYS